MKNIHLFELKKYLTKKLNIIYIFLGEDYYFLQKNQDLIIKFAFKQGFSKIINIDIEKNKDWEKMTLFYKTKNLFSQKIIIVINICIQNTNVVLIKKIYKIFSCLDFNILTILKLNHLSYLINKKNFFNQFQEKNNVISCYALNNLNLIPWIQYEIRERNITIEKQAYLLLCKYYNGDNLFIINTLNMIANIWPNTYITYKIIKTIIINFIDYSALDWINYIFQFKTKKAISILYYFYEKKYNPLILVRILQQDLLKLIYIKRENYTSIDCFLKKNNIPFIRYKFFINACKKINYKNLFKAIQILVKIEINIKKKYNYSIWNQLQKLILILNNEYCIY